MNDIEYRLLLERICDAAIDVRIRQKEYSRTPMIAARNKRRAEKRLDLLIAQRAQMIAERGQYKAREKKQE
jgi:hypothetical protein